MQTVSIALCTYNGEKFLPQQLESFLNQSRLPDELVACDDCSTDSTVEILNQFKNRAPFPVEIHQNRVNLGSTKNFEKAIGLCNGDIIFLSDQDDIWCENKISRISNELRDKSGLLVFSNAELIDEFGNPLNTTLWEKWGFTPERQVSWRTNINAVDDLFVNDNKITGATLAFKRSLLEKALPFDLPFGFIHDAWLGLIAAAQNRLVFLDEILTKYRIHDEQQIGIGSGMTMGQGFGDLQEDYRTHQERFLKRFPHLRRRFRPGLIDRIIRRSRRLGGNER